MDDDYKDPSSQNKFYNLQYKYFYSTCFLLVYMHVLTILNFLTCYRNHIFIHREPLIASLTI